MDKFILYARRDGVEWYRCTTCQALSRGKPEVCPVCHGYKAGSLSESALDPTNKIDNALEKFKALFAKYGDNICKKGSER